MNILFGLQLEDRTFPANTTDYIPMGSNKLVQFLEQQLGLIGNESNINYLRIEQYRQALNTHLASGECPFYQASFEADPFATAEELLSRRDELKQLGWDFERGAGMPARLCAIAEIEQIIHTDSALQLLAGKADRFAMIMEALQTQRLHLQSITFRDPYELLPAHWALLFDVIKKTQKQVQLVALEQVQTFDETDLGALKRSIFHTKGKKTPQSLQTDGSLLIVKAKRASDAGAFLAKLLAKNESYRPTVLIPERSRTLDNALVMDGLPSLGIPSASLARPMLQILKLVPVFLWNPIDPYKILEFVSLAVKPLNDKLANEIARQMAQRPGLGSDQWKSAIKKKFDDLKEDKSLNFKKIEQQYATWFGRKRYNINGTAPKTDAISLFQYLQQWAAEAFEESKGKNTSLNVLGGQAKRIKELLEELPEQQLTYLQLERIVRTIYEPSPIIFEPEAQGRLDYVGQPSAFVAPVEDLLWWNFNKKEATAFFSKWYNNERAYLHTQNVHPNTPAQQNQLTVWQRKQPFAQVHGRLVLLMPEMVDGTEVHPHPIYGDMEATFDNLEAITYDISQEVGREAFEAFFDDLPNNVTLNRRSLGQPKPFLKIRQLDNLLRDSESYSSLDALFYYPYKWLFSYKLGLRASSILSVSQDNTLKGNLAHRLFEKLLPQLESTAFDRDTTYAFVEKELNALFKKEGAVLLMYGKEPERISFINTVQFAAWSLIHKIQHDKWKVLAVEKRLDGEFNGTPLKGFADLVLERDGEKAIVDLKWSGRTYRAQMIKNNEDLQLVLYSQMLGEKAGEWAHTAYFIIKDGKMVARNNLAFSDINAESEATDFVAIHENIYAQMQRTFDWRVAQLQAGELEIRVPQTIAAIESAYAEQFGNDMFDLLEMQNEGAKFDDYGVLISGV